MVFDLKIKATLNSSVYNPSIPKYSRHNHSNCLFFHYNIILSILKSTAISRAALIFVNSRSTISSIAYKLSTNVKVLT